MSYAHENRHDERPDPECAECEAEMLASMRSAGTGGTSYSKAELQEGFDLKREIRQQRTLGSYVVAPLSMLRCSECGDLLDMFGCCTRHGLLDPEALDGYDH